LLERVIDTDEWRCGQVIIAGKSKGFPGGGWKNLRHAGQQNIAEQALRHASGLREK